jgi:hypothetical protein
MAVGWGGADPTVQADPDDYELGTEYLAVADVTLTKVRVWTDGTEEGYTPRLGRIWSTAGALLGTATMPSTLPSGWSSYDLDVPIARAAGTRWIVSYSTGGRYGNISGALAGNVNSADGNVRALSSATATNGNGVFNATPTSFPTSTFGSTFYGIDVEYNVGLPGANAPTITGVTVVVAGLTVTVTIAATDPEGLAGATYAIEWGDGQSSSGAVATMVHTYAAGGLYGLLARVTDSTSLSDYHAAAANLIAPAAGLDVVAVLDAVVSHALASGLFGAVNGHEPASAPGSGLTAAVWVQALAPVRSSGLAATSGRLELTVRLYSNMTSEPPDAIDPAMLGAVSTLMAAYSGDFDLGQHVRHVDLLGSAGVPLSARAGYLRQDDREYRVMDITLPALVNDIFTQAP